MSKQLQRVKFAWTENTKQYKSPSEIYDSNPSQLFLEV